MSNWYLIQTKPKKEYIAQKNLRHQGYSVYCPLFQIKSNTKPLFPRYLFIRIEDNSKTLSPIRSTRGVSNFVRFGTDFAQVPDHIINSIKIQEQEIIEKAIDQSRLHNGDKVQITKGIFKGTQAIFEKHSDEERVILLLKVLQQEQRMKFFVDQFEVI